MECGISMVKTSPVYLPWFPMSKIFAKLTKNFDICQKFRYIFDIFDIRRYLSKIDGYFQNFHLFSMEILQRLSYTGQIHTFQKCIQNHPRTLRGLEKQLFRFLSVFCQKHTFLVHFRLNLGLKTH